MTDPISLTLYSARACPFAHRTRLVLAHKGLPFELIEIDLENKPSWFHTVSGYSKVPALEHGDQHIWESAVINEYLEEVFPQPSLLPREPGARAEARIWIDYANTRLAPVFGKLLRVEGEAQEQSARREFLDVLAYIEQGLAQLSSGGPFFLGTVPSLVDFAFYPWFERLPALGHFRDVALGAEHPLLRRWLEASSALDAVQSQRSATEFYIERYARFATRSRRAA